MSLYKRKGSPNWWIKLTHNGKKIQRSSGTADKALAQEYHDRLKVELWEQEKLGRKPRRTWDEAVIRWIEETQHKATQHDDITQLRWLDVHFGGQYLDTINRDRIDDIKRARLRDKVSNATVNRMLALVRAILRRAALEWEWIDRYPKVSLLKEPKLRIRWLHKKEAEKLINELPPHLAKMARFSLETGLRQSNVTGLQWSQVDLERACAWIHPDQAKARRAIAVPLSEGAVRLLRGERGKHPDFVFTFRGKPVTQVNTKAWRSALKRAGIENFRWHDLRHTWASWHIQAGTPLHVLQELGGWETVDMVKRYAHLSSDHLKNYALEMFNDKRLVEEANKREVAKVYNLATFKTKKGHAVA